MVGMVLRFWPEYVELQRRIAAGELGRPLAVSAFRLSPPAAWNEWMADPAQSGGVPVDLLIHDFDQMNWLLGTPRRVYARAPVPGHVLAVVDYDGAQGIAEGSMAMPKAYPFSSNVRVLAEGGVAEYAFSAAPAEDGGNVGASDAPRGLRLYPRAGDPVTVPVESADPWGPEIAYFVECIEAGRAPVREAARRILLEDHVVEARPRAEPEDHLLGDLDAVEAEQVAQSGGAAVIPRHVPIARHHHPVGGLGHGSIVADRASRARSS